MNRLLTSCFALVLVSAACVGDPPSRTPATADGGGSTSAQSGGVVVGVGAGGTNDAGDSGDDGGGATAPAPPAPTMATATRDTVVWKRYRAVENDLMRALALPKDELCHELGSFSCVDDAHLAALGGNEPFELTQYVPVPAPTVTTPFALERVVLSACARRAELDAAQPPEARAVFTAFELTPGATVDAASLDALGTTLYRRLLARDPLPEELAALQPLRDDDTAALDVAKLACFAVGTTVEFSFQ